MFLYRSNQSERLVDTLAEVLRRPQRDPFAPELIVVQSKGMERWLSLELGRRLGVCAHAQFPFPRHLIERIFDAVLGDPKEQSAAFSEQQLMWAIAALLPGLLTDAAFAPIARYLADDGSGALRIGLAQRVARVFDDYSVYRPELLLGWERGQDQGWEACLWRALIERHGRWHRAARAERLLQALAHLPPRGSSPVRLPERLCLFGISSLPPIYLSVLSALARHVETHLFVLSPSREYLGDVRTRRSPHAETSSAVEGHPLLASQGRLAREFQELLEQRTEYEESEHDLYRDPGADNLLHTLQSDILHLRSRGELPDPTPRLPLAKDDRSIEVHVCHGPMRELEVLHDQLVQALEDKRLEPHEIVVMTPDIEAYAPVIEAVFSQKSGRPQLPYSVADRKTRSTHEVVAALGALIETIQGRMTASAVLDLLSMDCVRRRFQLESEQLGTLRSWVEQAGVRWGVDAAHRAELAQPSLTENTWRFGLDRMLLGYAMDGDAQHLFAGVLPSDQVEGSEAELLGKLAEACQRLFQARLALRSPRPLRAWRDDLLGWIDKLIDPGPAAAHEQQLIALALTGLADAAQNAGFEEPIDLRTLQTQLDRTLEDRLPARGLLDRGITFCQLVPMRSIPFKLVCLIGMNDDAFPGTTVHLGFDRLAEHGKRQLGDRSRRDDDRYMFLEALLSARERLIISYVGRGIHDNRVMPPSVVVGELLDAIHQGFGLEDQASDRTQLEARLCLEHRLHAFSLRYFDQSDTRLFSYARQYCDGARALGQERHNPPLLSSPLPATEEPFALTVDALVAWLTAPIRTFLQQRLGLFLGKEIGVLPDREPLELEQLERWQLAHDLIELTFQGLDARALLPAVQARGVLPLGTVGSVAYEELVPQVEALVTAARRYRGASRLDPLPIEIALDGAKLTGNLEGLYKDAQLHVTYSRIGRRFELAHFIRHVVLCCALARDRRPAYPTHSIIVARSKDGDAVTEISFGPIEAPERLLQTWVELVRQAQRFALPFVYESSQTYAETIASDGTIAAQKALGKARKLFEAKEGYSERPYVALLFPDFDALLSCQQPLDFASLADAVFGPLFRARSML